MPVIPESHLDILHSTALAHVATIGPKGEPQVSPVWFRWDGDHILLSMNKVRQKYRNLQRDTRIALSIVDPAHPYRSMVIRGKVARVDDDPEFMLSNALSQKYLGRDVAPEERQPGEQRAVLVIEPERVHVFPF